MIELDDILENCLEDIEDGRSTAGECLQRHADIAATLSPLLLTAERFREAPSVLPSTAFRATARRRMLNVLAVTPNNPQPAHQWPRISLRPNWGLGSALLRVAAIVIAILIVSGSTAALAQSSMPGSPLYPAKLALEDARLAVTWNTADRVGLHLDMADRRISELKEMAGEVTPGDLKTVEDRYESSVRSVVDGVMSAGAPASLATTVESRLAAQDQQLRTSMGQAGPGSEMRSAFQRCYDFLSRERIDLGGWRPNETPMPAGAGNGTSPGNQDWQHGPGATANPTAVPAMPGDSGMTHRDWYGGDTMPHDPHWSAGQWMTPGAGDDTHPMDRATPSWATGDQDHWSEPSGADSQHDQWEQQEPMAAPTQWAAPSSTPQPEMMPSPQSQPTWGGSTPSTQQPSGTPAPTWTPPPGNNWDSGADHSGSSGHDEGGRSSH